MILDSINVAVFASGNGTNAQNIFRFAKGKRIKIRKLICDNPDAKVIGRAKSFQIPVEVIPYSGSRQEHEKAIVSVVEGVDWIFLAGYMRILSPEFINLFFDRERGTSRIINIHPSLLPKYPGLNAYERAYRSNDLQYGVTLHYVDSGIDSGRIIEQVKLERLEYDSLDEFVERGMRAEYQLYRNFMTKILEGEIR